MRATLCFFILLYLLLFPFFLFSNGLVITNLNRDSLAQTVSFDIQWQTSWRYDGLASPFNWDAAWVFVKFRDCAATADQGWEHGTLSTNPTDHDFGDLESVRSDGTSTGIDPDGLGVMLRRTSTGLYGNPSPTSITLFVPNMDQNTAYNIRVVGIEMVFVPAGAYELGAVTYSSSFSVNNTATDPTPLTISSEAAQTILSHASGLNASVALPASFPKGFDGFHIMKYEISQGQYATFLNTISPVAQLNRYPGNYTSFRNQLTATGNNPLSLYLSDRTDRAQNYLGFNDVAAYLDWAALRPMTEMEYEKACRGIATGNLDEYAWGTDNIAQLVEITGPEDGTEIPLVLPANAHFSYTNLQGGDDGYGPVRVGIMALPTNMTREQSGAGYYAMMEMSGNVMEPCVAVKDETSATGTYSFTNAPGDGILNALGNANEAGWPGESSGAIIGRGGSWASSDNLLRISDRSQINWSGTRANNTGGRGVRN